jgi:site-specific recombinase XerD
MTDVATTQTNPPDPLTGEPPARGPAALAALMRQAGLTPAALETTAGWLSGERRTSQRTQLGYITDLSRWVAWCRLRGTDPAGASAIDADLFGAAMRAAGHSDATRARRLSAVSSWYRYLLRQKVTTLNPFDAMERPRAPKTSSTRGLSESELEKLLAYASERETPRNNAVLSVMAATACRVFSITGAQADALGYDSGHQTIDLPVKGHDVKRFVVPAITVSAVDTYLDERGHDPGPMFLGAKGGPLGQAAIYRLIQRAAAGAGIPQAHELSPHGIRHTVLTILHSRNYPTHIIQDLAGHADSRTTRRYDLARGSLDRSPANDLGAIFAAGIARWAPKYREGAAP